MRRIISLFGVALMLVSSAIATPSASAAGDGDFIAGSYIVTVVHGASPDRVANDHAERHGAQVSHVYRYALRGYAARMSEAAAARVARDSRVRAVVADRSVEAYDQAVPTGIDRIDGELSGTVSGSGSGSVDVDVAIIDTGIDLDHPDLNVVGGTNCSRGNSYDDGNGHGTHVAGTVGAKDDNQGLVGVAPGARLLAVRVLDNSGSGTWSSVICGVDWVTANASTIEVANMSLGGSGSDAKGCGDGGLQEAICNSVDAGVTYAVAAGNSDDDAAKHVPAAYDQVITVSALADFDGQTGGLGSPTCRTDVDDTFANFSNWGPDVDIIAPGVCINSTWKGGGYNTISGTSMASPHVAGAAALYLVDKPGSTPAQVQFALQNSGGIDWNNGDDGDTTKEPLLNVAGLEGTATNDSSGGTTDNAPIAEDQSLTVAPGSETTITLAASDDAACPLTFELGTYSGTGQLGSLTTPQCNTTTNVSTTTVTYTAPASEGNDSFTFTATDGVAQFDTGTVSITVSSNSSEPVPTSARVESITYSWYGGRFGNNHLEIAVVVTDGAGNPISGAAVSVTVYRTTSDGTSVYGSATGTTDSTGRVAFSAKNAPDGCYTTDVTDISLDGTSLGNPSEEGVAQEKNCKNYP